MALVDELQIYSPLEFRFCMSLGYSSNDRPINVSVATLLSASVYHELAEVENFVSCQQSYKNTHFVWSHSAILVNSTRA